MRKTFLFGTLSLLSAQFVFVLSGYAVNIGLGRLLGPSNYGAYGVVISLIGLVNLIFVSGVQTAVSKFISQNYGQSEAVKRSALKLNLLLGLLFFVVYFFSAPLIAIALNDISLAPFIQLSALIIPGYALYTVFLGYFNGLKQYNKQALISITYSLAKVFMILFLVLLGFSIAGAIVGFALAPLLALVFGLGFSSPRKSTKVFDSAKLISLGISVTFFALCFKFSMLIGLFIIKSVMVENAVVGYYNAAFQISSLPYFFNIALIGVLFPVISYSASNETAKEIKHHLFTALRYFLVFILPIAILISIFSPQIIAFLYSPEYLSGAGSLAILAIANIFICLFSLLSFVLIATDQHKKVIRLGLFVLLLSFSLNWLFVSMYGLEGAAIATFIAFFIGSIIAAVAVWCFLLKFH